MRRNRAAKSTCSERSCQDWPAIAASMVPVITAGTESQSDWMISSSQSLAGDFLGDHHVVAAGI